MRIFLDVPVRHHACAIGTEQLLKARRKKVVQLVEASAAAGLFDIGLSGSPMTEHLDWPFGGPAYETRAVTLYGLHDSLQIDHSRWRAQARAAERAVCLPR